MLDDLPDLLGLMVSADRPLDFAQAWSRLELTYRQARKSMRPLLPAMLATQQHEQSPGQAARIWCRLPGLAGHARALAIGLLVSGQHALNKGRLRTPDPALQLEIADALGEDEPRAAPDRSAQIRRLLVDEVEGDLCRLTDCDSIRAFQTLLTTYPPRVDDKDARVDHARTLLHRVAQDQRGQSARFPALRLVATLMHWVSVDDWEQLLNHAAPLLVSLDESGNPGQLVCMVSIMLADSQNKGNGAGQTDESVASVASQVAGEKDESVSSQEATAQWAWNNLARQPCGRFAGCQCARLRAKPAKSLVGEALYKD